MKHISNSIEETKKIARLIRKCVTGGDIITLSGELGAGKTTFTQALAGELGVFHSLQSPTFTIMNIYPIENHPTIKTLCHIDAYRLNNQANLSDIGFIDYLGSPNTLSMIEWPENIKDYLSSYKKIAISIEYGMDENQRIFTTPENQ